MGLLGSFLPTVLPRTFWSISSVPFFQARGTPLLRLRWSVGGRWRFWVPGFYSWTEARLASATGAVDGDA